MSAQSSRTCVVTGATSGIGRALAHAFCRDEARVWAVGRTRDRLDALVEETPGGLVVPILADLSLVNEVESAARAIIAGSNRVDVLVHSAGEISLGLAESLSTADLDRQYAVNLRAPYALTRALLPALKHARGQIVFVNSSAALRPSAVNALYASTKAGLKAMADGLRDEVNEHGVRVISIFVGRTATPMQVAVHEFEGREYHHDVLLQPGDVVNAVQAALSLSAGAEMTDLSVRPMRHSAS